MDLQLYLRVLSRFRLLVLVGLILAAALAFVSFAKVSFSGGAPKVSYRKPQYYQSQAAILVTQKGFPQGRTILPVKPIGQSGTYVTDFADDGRFAGLAVLYSQLATSDAVRKRLRKDGPVRGTIAANAYYDQLTRQQLPLMYVSGKATKEAWAIQLANRAATTIRDVVEDRQIAAKIPPKQRVVLQVFSVAREAKIVEARKKTIPIVIFLTVLLATVGLAFILENLRPRTRSVEGAEPVPEVEKLAAAVPAAEVEQPAARTSLTA